MSARGRQRCEVDEAYSYSYSEDPAIGTLTPILCSHFPTFLVRLLSRLPSADASGRPSRGFALCATHRAIVEALDRTIVLAGGKPRVLGVSEAPEGP